MPIITGKTPSRQPRTPSPAPQYTDGSTAYVLEAQRLIALHLTCREELHRVDSTATRRLTGMITETMVQIARLWDQMTVDHRERFGFHHLLGVTTPQATAQEVLSALYSHRKGLARVIPFPDDFCLAEGNLRRAYDLSVAPSEHSMRTIMFGGEDEA